MSHELGNVAFLEPDRLTTVLDGDVLTQIDGGSGLRMLIVVVCWPGLRIERC